ncbi:MAG: hypothetical protein WKF52_08655 [Sphingomicrobium sp.]
MNELLGEVDRRWDDASEGQGNEPPLNLAVASVAMIRMGLLRLKGIQAEIKPLEELVVALSNVIAGKRDPLLQPLKGRREPGMRVRMLRARAVLAVEFLIKDGASEEEALRLVARKLGLLVVPAVAVKPKTIRDWRTDVKGSGSMPEERSHYQNAEAALAAKAAELADAGFETYQLNRKQMFGALFGSLADAERKFGV